MEAFLNLLAPLAAYPRWFVITCLVLVALGVGWVLVKLVKWTLYLAFAAVLLALVLAAAAWLLG
ncbi:MAG: hypothetical protein PHE83_06645 [Opitutaceae bacterium]|nr:hypothetical protein [Opitutaceae bacterium]